MAQEETRLKTPELAWVKEMKRRSDQMIDDGAVVEFEQEADAVFLTECLDWIITKRANQQDYHRKRNYTQKEEMRLLEAALNARGFDTNAIKKQAASVVADKITDETEAE